MENRRRPPNYLLDLVILSTILFIAQHSLPDFVWPEFSERLQPILTSQVQSLNPREQGAEEECVTVTASTMGPRIREQDVLGLVHDVLQRSVVDYDCVPQIKDSPITTEQGVQVFQEELLLRSRDHVRWESSRGVTAPYGRAGFLP